MVKCEGRIEEVSVDRRIVVRLDGVEDIGKVRIGRCTIAQEEEDDKAAR